MQVQVIHSRPTGIVLNNCKKFGMHILFITHSFCIKNRKLASISTNQAVIASIQNTLTCSETETLQPTNIFLISESSHDMDLLQADCDLNLYQYSNLLYCPGIFAWKECNQSDTG